MNPRVTCEFPAQQPVILNFDGVFVVRLHKLLNKMSTVFETDWQGQMNVFLNNVKATALKGIGMLNTFSSFISLDSSFMHCLKL